MIEFIDDFLFSLNRDDNGKQLAIFKEIGNISSYAEQPAETTGSKSKLHLLKVRPISQAFSRCLYSHLEAKRFLGNLQIRVLGQQDTVIGIYYFSQVEIVWEQSISQNNGFWNVCTEGVLLTPIRQESIEVWEAWRVDPPRRKGEWIKLSLAHRRGWIDVVRIHASTNLRSYMWQPVVLMDGAHVSDRSSFYCALGESMDGPGGYFGADLDGLADCLREFLTIHKAFKLIWLDHQVAKNAMSSSCYRIYSADDVSIGDCEGRMEKEDQSYFDEIIAVFKSFGLDVELR